MHNEDLKALLENFYKPVMSPEITTGLKYVFRQVYDSSSNI